MSDDVQQRVDDLVAQLFPAPTEAEALAGIAESAMQGHAVIDAQFDQLDRQQLASAQQQVERLRQAGHVIDQSVARMLAPVRAIAFRQRLAAHAALDELVEDAMEQSMAQLALAHRDADATLQ